MNKKTKKYFKRLEDTLFSLIECYIDILNNGIKYVYERAMIYDYLMDAVELYNVISDSDTVVYLFDGKYYIS